MRDLAFDLTRCIENFDDRILTLGSSQLAHMSVSHSPPKDKSSLTAEPQQQRPERRITVTGHGLPPHAVAMLPYMDSPEDVNSRKRAREEGDSPDAAIARARAQLQFQAQSQLQNAVPPQPSAMSPWPAVPIAGYPTWSAPFGAAMPIAPGQAAFVSAPMLPSMFAPAWTTAQWQQNALQQSMLTQAMLGPAFPGESMMTLLANPNQAESKPGGGAKQHN